MIHLHSVKLAQRLKFYIEHVSIRLSVLDLHTHIKRKRPEVDIHVPISK